jgi:putative FmdB family regulatory protein
MPTYEYKCTNCGHKFELFQTMTAKPVEKCPVCGGKVKRLIGAGAGPLFKGSGFYQTDYKKTSKPPVKKEEPKKDTNSKNPESKG